MYIAPRQNYPAFYIQPIFSPLAEVNWGDPNPDFHYHWAWIDGAHSYRVWGNKKDGYWSTLQIYKGFWGDDVQGNIANIDFDDIPTDKDGNFEIFLGPNPPATPDGKLWVKLDPNLHNSALNVREVYNDWARTRPLQIHVDILDRPADAPVFFDEAELAARIERATKFLAFNYDFILSRFRQTVKDGVPGEPIARNVITAPKGSDDKGGNPLACYAGGLFDLRPDEALVMEVKAVKAKYWSVQLETIWRQTIDYTYHQSSLNGTQAAVDGDGKARFVIAARDPGVPNWIDTAGQPLGGILWRWYAAETCPVATALKVKLADVRAHLPKDTPVVTSAARVQALELRTAAARVRWGQ